MYVRHFYTGQYGEVNLCEMTTPGSPPSLVGGGNSNTATKLVAVKQLQTSADESTKMDFLREIRIMSKLRHENIVQVCNIHYYIHSTIYKVVRVTY